MAFRGWSAEALKFFEGLEADNSKGYWEARKADYDVLVRRPMAELLAELGDEFGEGKIFRPYRDVRFSRDKSPYKTNIAAVLGGGGYIDFSADGLGAGTGYYVMAADQLERFRTSIDDGRLGAKLVQLVDGLSRAGIEVTAHETLKSAPRGYAKDHPRIELLRHKGLVAWKHWPAGAWLGTAQAKKRVVDLLRAARPLCGWLDENVGESTQPVHG